MEFLKLHGLTCTSIQFLDYLDGRPNVLELVYEEDTTGISVKISLPTRGLPRKAVHDIEEATNDYIILTLSNNV